MQLYRHFKVLILWLNFLMSTSTPAIKYGCFDNGIVPYNIRMEDFSSTQVLYIKEMIAKIHNATCVRWVDYIEHGIDSFLIVQFSKADEPDCFFVPEILTKHVIHHIRLSSRCFEGRAVLHEMFHALGFQHEHQRADRNCYVDVAADAGRSYEIIKHKNGYDLEWIESFPYDKYSIMHYRRSQLMQAKNERSYSKEPLGTEEGRLSPMDVWKLLYRFCHFPHFCDVNPLTCKFMEESEKDCAA